MEISTFRFLGVVACREAFPGGGLGGASLGWDGLVWLLQKTQRYSVNES